MLIMNQLSSPSLGGVTHVWPSSQVSYRSLPGLVQVATLADIESRQRANIYQARDTLYAMYKEMHVANALKRDRHDKKRGVKMAKSVVGDYVLYQDV